MNIEGTNYLQRRLKTTQETEELTNSIFLTANETDHTVNPLMNGHGESHTFTIFILILRNFETYVTLI